MNKETLRQEIAKRLDTMSKEEVVGLVYFLVVVYSMFTSLVQNLGISLDRYSEAFGKTTDEEGNVANSFLADIHRAGNVEKEEKDGGNTSNPV